MRKIIQIAAASDGVDDYIFLFALCDDGTIWSLMDTGWLALAAIPQYPLDPEQSPDAIDLEGGL